MMLADVDKCGGMKLCAALLKTLSAFKLGLSAMKYLSEMLQAPTSQSQRTSPEQSLLEKKFKTSLQSLEPRRRACDPSESPWRTNRGRWYVFGPHYTVLHSAFILAITDVLLAKPRKGFDLSSPLSRHSNAILLLPLLILTAD